MTNIVKFRSMPMFEEKLCTRCRKIGMPDEWQWWPVDETYWYKVNNALDLRMCRACRSETQAAYKLRFRAKHAANDAGAYEVAA